MMKEAENSQQTNRNRYGNDWEWYAKEAKNKAMGLKLDTPKLLAYWDKVNPSKAEQWRKTAQEFDFDNLPNSRNWWKLSDDEIHDFFMWVKNIRADISIDEMIEAQRYHSEQLNKIQ